MCHQAVHYALVGPSRRTDSPGSSGEAAGFDADTPLLTPSPVSKTSAEVHGAATSTVDLAI